MASLPAVFFKNHRPYLEGAAQRNVADPEALTTFRSEKEWTSAAKYLQKGPIPAYAAAIGTQNEVSYAAQLQAVELKPDEAKPTTRVLLGYDLPATAKERVWTPGQGTLYAISHCRPIPPRPFTALTKLSDGAPLAADYRYGYVLVHALPDLSLTSGEVGVDSGPLPVPLRRENITSRIVRNSALVRALKAKHRNACQICGKPLSAPDGRAYSEGHHLRPLGGEHAGPDVAENILIVCPNHHALLDMGWLPLDHASLRVVAGHRVDESYVYYHNRTVCGGLSVA